MPYIPSSCGADDVSPPRSGELHTVLQVELSLGFGEIGLATTTGGAGAVVLANRLELDDLVRPPPPPITVVVFVIPGDDGTDVMLSSSALHSESGESSLREDPEYRFRLPPAEGAVTGATVPLLELGVLVDLERSLETPALPEFPPRPVPVEWRVFTPPLDLSACLPTMFRFYSFLP